MPQPKSLTPRRRPTARQKRLATDTYPMAINRQTGKHFNRGVTRQEVCDAKLACRGHWWNDPDNFEFVAFNSTGRQKQFFYDSYRYKTGGWNVDREMFVEAKREARRWARR